MPDANYSLGESFKPSERDSLHTKELDLVQRVIATPAFARSTLLSQFVLYVCDRKLRERESEITEYQIGVHALGRPASFHTGEDNIVRNYARLLRRRLEEYFAGKGYNEPIRIVIPRGHYVPIFEANRHTSVENPDTTEPGFSSAKSPAARASRRIAALNLRPFIRWSWIPISLLLIGGIGTTIYWATSHSPRDLYTLFWKQLLDPGRTTYVVTGDSGLSILQNITDQNMSLNEYLTGSLKTGFPSFNPSAQQGIAQLGASHLSGLVSTADLSIVNRITHQSTLLGSRLIVRFAHEMRMEELNHSNVILIGGRRANPWVQLFEPELNFQRSFPTHVNGVRYGARSFINKHPLPGEQTFYLDSPGEGANLTYSLIAFLPSADGEGYTLLLEGEDLTGSQAAGNFVFDHEKMNPILTKARLADGRIGPFEALVETRSVGADTLTAHVVAEHFGTVRPSK